MKVISAKIRNFGSYSELDFNFQDKGLSLISGATGSGKSTLCDIIPWVLFGKTSKGGAVDEIRSWGETDTTYGHVVLDMGDCSLWITRTRSPNDLYYILDGVWEHPKRGKDLSDTQKQLNHVLGINYEMYTAGTYFNEFSNTAHFFTTTAKIRRSITEQIVDLSLSKTLSEQLKKQEKLNKTKLEELTANLTEKRHKLTFLENAIKEAIAKDKQWKSLQTSKIADLQYKSQNFAEIQQESVDKLFRKCREFEEEKNLELQYITDEIEQTKSQLESDSFYDEQINGLKSKINELSASTCKECGNPLDSYQLLVLTKDLNSIQHKKNENTQLSVKIKRLSIDLLRHKNKVNPYSQQLQQERTRVNNYTTQLDETQKEISPYEETARKNRSAASKIDNELISLNRQIHTIEGMLSDIELLAEVCEAHRNILIKQTIVSIESKTNEFLSTYFDAEIRVKFSAELLDQLDVSILRDGMEISYTQLSKGQRQLLKLCFGVSVMEAICSAQSVSFNCLFFDEVFEGLDEEMKAKGFNLLQSLTSKYESIFAIDHSEELKTRFTKGYHVELTRGHSEIKEI